MKKELTQLQIIKEFAVSLLSQNSLEDLLWDMAEKIGTLLNYEDCIIYLNIDGQLEQMAAYGVKNPSSREIAERIRIPLGEGIVGTVAKTGKAELVNSTLADPRYIPDLYCGQSELAVPILSNGEVIGVIDSENNQPNWFSPDDLEMLQAIANIAASRISAAMSQQEIARVTGEGAQYKLQLANEREWLKTILDSIQDGIVATDEDLKVVMISATAGELLGISPEQAKGHPLSEIFHLFDSNKITTLPLDQTLAGKGEIGGGKARRRHVAFKMGPIRYGNNLIGRLIVFRDIAREEFLEREAEKAQRLESLGVLAGGIAHDFNNNIQSVMSSLHALRVVTKDSQASIINTAEMACLQSTELSRQLLTFSKGGSPIMRPVDTKSLLQQSVDLAMAGRNSTVQIDVEEDVSNVLVDIIQIEQVIGNILINADQAMPGGGQIKIDVANSKLPATLDEDGIKITIQDNGIGISESDLKRVFDPYFSTKSGGNGLGLTISYSIIKRHSGELVVDSRIGKGTTFTIYLPATDLEQSSKAEPETIPTAKQAKILLVDDNALVLETTKALLVHYGHEVVTAKNQKEAISAFQSDANGRPFELAILDLTIRGDAGGLEIGRRLLEMAPNLKLIVASGYAKDPVFKNYRDFGFRAVLEKPFNGNKLANVVQKTLAESELESE